MKTNAIVTLGPAGGDVVGDRRRVVSGEWCLKSVYFACAVRDERVDESVYVYECLRDEELLGANVLIVYWSGQLPVVSQRLKDSLGMCNRVRKIARPKKTGSGVVRASSSYSSFCNVSTAFISASLLFFLFLNPLRRRMLLIVNCKDCIRVQGTSPYDIQALHSFSNPRFFC